MCACHRKIERVSHTHTLPIIHHPRTLKPAKTLEPVARACVAHFPYPPSTHNGVGGSKGYGRRPRSLYPQVEIARGGGWRRRSPRDGGGGSPTSAPSHLSPAYPYPNPTPPHPIPTLPHPNPTPTQEKVDSEASDSEAPVDDEPQEEEADDDAPIAEEMESPDAEEMGHDESAAMGGE